MKGRIWIVVAVIVALGGGVGLGALLFGGDDDGDDVATDATATTASPSDDDSTTTTGAEQGPTAPATVTTLPPLPATTVPIEGLADANLELAEAINRAHQLTYHILLRSVDEDSPNETELWRRLPEARRDVRLGSGDAHLETREYRSPTLGHVGCLIDSGGLGTGGQTTCLQAPSGQLDPADPVLGVVDPAAGPITASDATLGLEPIRCFTQTVDGQEHVACFDDDGVPAVLDGGDGRLERVGDVEQGITDDVFVPPDAAVVRPDGSDSDGSDEGDEGSA